MRAFVVYESMYGNTRRIAEEIGRALAAFGEVTTMDVAMAPTTLPAWVDLLIVGGPTHASSMSRTATRRQAVAAGGRATDLETGLREWLRVLTVSSRGPATATFDTRVKVPLLPGSAANGAARHLRRLGLAVRDSESFYVEDQDGPLRPGELERAAAWARILVHDLHS
jgi:hypothetical protein